MFGDINGDGILDMLATNYVSGALVLVGNGNATFKAATLFPSIGPAALADVNSDGYDDLLGSTTGFELQVRLATGSGTFGAVRTIVLPVRVDNVRSVDLDNDGKKDLLINSSDGSGILLGNGNGTFNAITSIESGSFDFAEPADLNGDGIVDIWGMATGAAISVFFGNGNGSFKFAATFATNRTATSGSAAGDLDGDGALDLITSSYNDTEFVLLFGQTSSTSMPAIDFPTVNLTAQASARSALDLMTSVSSTLSELRGAIGAAQSRLNVAAALATVTSESLLTSAARIMDADIASESAAMTATSILQQAAAAVLSSANQQPALALQLLH